jgi:hypothetical protein
MTGTPKLSPMQILLFVAPAPSAAVSTLGTVVNGIGVGVTGVSKVSQLKAAYGGQTGSASLQTAQQTQQTVQTVSEGTSGIAAVISSHTKMMQTAQSTLKGILNTAKAAGFIIDSPGLWFPTPPPPNGWVWPNPGQQSGPWGAAYGAAATAMNSAITSACLSATSTDWLSYFKLANFAMDLAIALAPKKSGSTATSSASMPTPTAVPNTGHSANTPTTSGTSLAGAPTPTPTQQLAGAEGLGTASQTLAAAGAGSGSGGSMMPFGGAPIGATARRDPGKDRRTAAGMVLAEPDEEMFAGRDAGDGVLA